MRARSHQLTFGTKVLRMARSSAPRLAKLLQLLHTTILVAAQMQHDVLQRASMPIAQHESIPIPPFRTRRTVIPTGRPKEMRHGSATHGCAGMSRVGLLDHVGGEGADGVDAFELEGRALVGCQLGGLVVLLAAFVGGLS